MTPLCLCRSVAQTLFFTSTPFTPNAMFRHLLLYKQLNPPLIFIKMQCDLGPSALPGTTTPSSSPLFSSPSEPVIAATGKRSPPPLARRTSRAICTSPTPAWSNACVVPFPGYTSVSPTGRLSKTLTTAPREETSTNLAFDPPPPHKTAKSKWNVGQLPGRLLKPALLKISLPISECVVTRQSDGSLSIICPELSTSNPSAVCGFTENQDPEKLGLSTKPTLIYIKNPVLGGGTDIRTRKLFSSTTSTFSMLNSAANSSIGQTSAPLLPSAKAAPAVFGPRSSLSQANTQLKEYGLTTKLELLSKDASPS